MFTKDFYRFSSGFICIVALAIAGIIFLAKDGGVFRRYDIDPYQLFASDPAGGKTPEETLILFRDALRRGDVDLASRYFVKERQAEMRRQFQVGKDNGSIATFLKVFEQELVEIRVSDGKYVYQTRENVPFIFELVFDKGVDAWKLLAI